MLGFHRPSIYCIFLINMNTPLQELEQLVSTCNGAILYKPLVDETDYAEFSFPIKIHSNRIILPANKDENPFAWADKCIEYFKKDTPYILIPGTRFDIEGTRHGKGGGWYDRFLSKVPKTWLKIGVTDTSKLSSQKLIKQPWDQNVGWIIAYGKDGWNIFKSTL